MSWNRRQFLTALGGLIAATGLDPGPVVTALAEAPVEEIKRALAAYTIRIGKDTFPLLSLVAPRMERPIIDWTAGASGAEEAVLGILRVSPAEVRIAATELFPILKAATDNELVDFELRLGKGGPRWTFKGFVTGVCEYDEETADVLFLPSGPTTLKEDE